MERIFSDSEMEQEFRQNGYAVRPFLGADEIKAFNDLCESLLVEIPMDYYTTPFSQDIDYRRRIYEGIKAIVQEKLKKIIPHYRLCIGAFLTKRAKSERGKVGLHQDYSFVDNTIHTGVNIWCPLINVDEHNGGMKVVIGSHTFIKHISATPTNPSPFTPVSEELDTEFTTKLSIRAGSALVYDGSLLHGSDENLSEHPRIAFGCVLVPETVAPRLYTWNEQAPTKLDILEVTEEFLLQFRPGTYISKPLPEGVKSLGLVDYAFQPLRSEDLAELKSIQTELTAD